MKKKELERKTVRQLSALARQEGIAGRSRMRKVDLVAALAKRYGRRSRATSGRSPARPFQESTELPAAYARTTLVLMEVDPYRIHAYWEVTREDRAAAPNRLGSGTPPVRWLLRFYEVTQPGAADPGSSFEVSVDLAPGNWYVTVPGSGRSYLAELGPLAADGRFVAACRSNVVHVPRGEASAHYRPDWLEVKPSGEITRRSPATSPAPFQVTSPAWNALPVPESAVEFPGAGEMDLQGRATDIESPEVPPAADQGMKSPPFEAEGPGGGGGFRASDACIGNVSSYSFGERERENGIAGPPSHRGPKRRR